MGGIETGGGLVLCAEGGADGFEADPVSGALVTEDWAPASGGVEGSRGRAADDVGAGAGDSQNARPSGEGRVQGDFFVAAEDEGAGDSYGDRLSSPGADGGDGEAGESEAGTRDLGERNGGGGGDLRKHGVEAGGGFGLGDAHELDGAGGGAGEDLVLVSEEAVGFSAAGVDGQVVRHKEP